MTRRVVVIGVGGIGGWLCRGLAPMLEARAPGSLLILVDGDIFEAKNLDRQDFMSMGYKVEVRAAELQPRYPNTVIVPVPYWIVAEEPDDIQPDAGGKTPAFRFLQEGDIVLVVVDNHATRKIVFDAARAFDNIDVLTGGNDEGYFGSVYHYRRRDGVDVTDHPAMYHKEFVNPADRNPGELSCEQRAELPSGTQLIFTNMAVASMIGTRVNQILADEDPTATTETLMELGLGMAQSVDRRVTAPVTV